MLDRRLTVAHRKQERNEGEKMNIKAYGAADLISGVIATAAIFLASATSLAAPITIEATGIVTSVVLQGGGLALYFPSVPKVGDSYTFRYTYESTTPDAVPADLSQGIYTNALTALSLTVGSNPAFDFPTLPQPQNSIEIGITGQGDFYNVLYAGASLTGFTINLISGFNTDRTAFASDALPTTAPNIALFGGGGPGFPFFHFQSNQIGGSDALKATVTGLTVVNQTAASITKLDPAEGPAGSTIAVNGLNFGTLQGHVSVCGVIATTSFWSDTAVGVSVPSVFGPGTVCDVQVTTQNAKTSNALPFAITERGSISGSVRRSDGKPIGASIIVTGPLDSTVLSAGNDGTFQSSGRPSGSYTITPKLPGFTFQPPQRTLTLTSGGTLVTNFVGAPTIPVLAKLGPDHGAAGQRIIISGAGFGSSQGPASTVSFVLASGTSTAAVRSWTDNSIEVTVPTEVNSPPGSSALVTVTTIAGTSNPLSFAYQQPGKPVAVTVSGDFNPLVYSEFRLVEVDDLHATYEIAVQNNSAIWYILKPSTNGDVSQVGGSGFDIRSDFLIAPGQILPFGQVRFTRKSGLHFSADGQLNLESCLTLCDQRKVDLLFATSLEFTFRIALGTPFPSDFLQAALAGVSDRSPLFALAIDLFHMSSDLSWTGLGSIFSDILELPEDPFLDSIVANIVQRYNLPGFTWASRLTYAQCLGKAAFTLEYLTNLFDPAVPKSGRLDFNAK